ncbi:MAG TPA: ion transporter [Flavobacteriales bacterium]|nr:ion transporter [Flavobacteriales bacterium]HRE75063.1 ion transporter [Flavobacteriales bacterium]HRE96920.1 ion transporter [Flavobacteriales bacterium]HRJ36516.1 ion transporter [Flavobacteriales bacterium]HRJ40139.1 ion transporter [Flavobacteriales bacterium]
MREKIYRIIFFTDTRAGRNFDLLLLYLILINFLVVVMESVPHLDAQYGNEFYLIEWFFTGLFTLEYVIRILTSPQPFKYIFSFWGLIDLIAIIPGYLSVLVSGYHYLQGIRIFRLIRVFRILRLTRFSAEARTLTVAIQNSAYKIVVFMMFMMVIVIILGTIMYVIESGNPGFSSIPQAVYWAIVTVTTVGFGDVVPVTVLGKILASLTMLIGYVIIAVPTGITAMEFHNATKTEEGKKECGHCSRTNRKDARYCYHCGNQFPE